MHGWEPEKNWFSIPMFPGLSRGIGWSSFAWLERWRSMWRCFHFCCFPEPSGMWLAMERAAPTLVRKFISRWIFCKEIGRKRVAHGRRRNHRFGLEGRHVPKGIDLQRNRPVEESGAGGRRNAEGGRGCHRVRVLVIVVMLQFCF